MASEVVITGVGLVTPLGRTVAEVLGRIRQGEVAASPPTFDSTAIGCPLVAPIGDFDADAHFPQHKTLRLMGRDAQLAAVAARLALQDAALRPGETYRSEQIGLFGATGLTSMDVADVDRLVRLAADGDGSLDLRRFGEVALRRTRPILSFKLLANMPICFVSMLAGIRGPNAVYTPWEGQGAQAIAAGVRAVQCGDVPCALVGGCDVKTRLLSLVSLRQLGALASWSQNGQGPIPAEGAAFLVLEDGQLALDRGARVLARIGDPATGATRPGVARRDAFAAVLSALPRTEHAVAVAAADGDPALADDERRAMDAAGQMPRDILQPKVHLGNLYAAAAAVQVALAAAVLAEDGGPSHATAHCLGFGDQHAAFVLEAA